MNFVGVFSLTFPKRWALRSSGPQKIFPLQPVWRRPSGGAGEQWCSRASVRTVLSEYVDYPTWCAPPRHPKGAPPGVVPECTATNPVKDRGVWATRSRPRGPSPGAVPIQNASADARAGVTDGWTKKATHHTLFR